MQYVHIQKITSVFKQRQVLVNEQSTCRSDIFVKYFEQSLPFLVGAFALMEKSPTITVGSFLSSL